MANPNVVFTRGNLASLPEAMSDGTLRFVVDEGAIYLDTAEKRVRFGDFQEFEDLEALGANTNKSTRALYYVKDINCLAKWDGSRYVQINPDTGATKVSEDGSGNAITSITYDSASRTLTVHKDVTYLTAAEVDSAIKAKVGEMDDALTVREYVDRKTENVASEDEITAIKGRLDKIEGGEEGSIQKAVGDAKRELKGEIDSASERIAELETNDGTQDGKISALEEKIKGLSGAMHYKGAADSDPAAMEEFSGYASGDVVTWQEKEYVFDGEKFVEFGDVTAEAQRIKAVEDKLAGVDSTVTAYVGTQIAAAKTALVGTSEGVTASTIREGVAEAEKDAAAKDAALKKEIVGTNDVSSEDTVKGAKKYAEEKITEALTWGSF